MPETHKGPMLPVGEEMTPQDTTVARPSGTDQQQAQPNENLANQPITSDKTFDRDKQQHTWGDQDPQEGVSAGVTQGHADPQQPKHGRSAEATNKSSTGLPSDNNDDGKPPSGQNPRTHSEQKNS